MLSECYSLDLQRSGWWRTTLYCEMQRLLNVDWMLLTGSAEVMKMMDHTELWDATLYCEMQRLLNVVWMLLTGFVESRRLRTTRDCEMPRLADALWILLTGFADDGVRHEPHGTMRCRDCLMLTECYSLDLQRSWRWWTTLNCEMPKLPDALWMLLTGFAEGVMVTTHTGLWDCLNLSECYSIDLPRSWR